MLTSRFVRIVQRLSMLAFKLRYFRTKKFALFLYLLLRLLHLALQGLNFFILSGKEWGESQLHGTLSGTELLGGSVLPEYVGQQSTGRSHTHAAICLEHGERYKLLQLVYRCITTVHAYIRSNLADV